MAIKKEIRDHVSLIVVIVLLSPLFIAYQYSKTGWNILGRCLLLVVIVAQLTRTKGRLLGVVPASESMNFSVRTLFSYGYICLSAILISIWTTGDVVYSFINFTIFTSVFSYLTFLCWRTHNIDGLVRFVFTFGLISAFSTVIESIDMSLLPFVEDYINYANAINEENHLAANLMLDGSIRAFGIYSDGFVNGYFMNIAAALSLSKFLYSNSRGARILHFLIFVFFSVAIYLTLTRNCYLALLMSCLTISCFRFSIVRRVNARVFVWGWLICAFLLMFVSAYYVIFYSGFDLENTVSSRVFTWGVVLEKYILNGNLFGILFGYGIFQWGGDHQDTDLWALDNLFIQIFMSSGIMGLLVFFSWWSRLSVKLFNIARRRCDYFSISTCALFVQFVVVGVYNSSLYANPVVPIMFIMAFLVMYREDACRVAERKASV